MIATVSPAKYSLDETLSTLLYAIRAKSIKNKPVINENSKSTMLKNYELEIGRLKHELAIKSENQQVENIKKLTEQLNFDKMGLIKNKNSVLNEKERLSMKLTEHEQTFALERQRRMKLELDLATLESKMIVGGAPVEQLVFEQEANLQNADLQLSLEVEKKEGLKQQFDANKQGHDDLKSKLKSTQTELETISGKVLKIQRKLLKLTMTADKFTDDNRERKEELLQIIRNLKKELSLQITIIDHFIPMDEKITLEKRLQLDIKTQQSYLNKPKMIRIPPMSSNPLSVQPTCQTMQNSNSRYQYENVITLEFD